MSRFFPECFDGLPCFLNQCRRASLARLELKVAFEQVLDRLPDIDLVEDTEPELRPANFVSGYEEMPVTFSPVARVGA